ncbi:MAG: MmpS family transport accessory protein, partial [Mycobacterium sp.]
MSHLVTHDRHYPDDPDDYDDYPGPEYADYADDYDDYPPPADQRWRPVAVIAGAVFLAAAIGAAVIVNSDSSGSKATMVAPTRTVVATPGPTTSTAPAVPPSTSLAPETVTTLTPSQPAVAPSATAAPEAAAPAPPPVNPRTVVYTVTGTKRFFDLVSIIYTDAQGMPHTDVNVSLPWHR